MLSDLMLTLRQLRRTPVQTAIAILTLALGIGLSTTMGSLLKALVLDPFNYPQSERIVQVWRVVGIPLPVLDAEELRIQNTSFEALGFYSQDSYNIGGSLPVMVSGAPCTSEVFPALGVRSQLGRWLLPADDLQGAARVAVISHGLWQRAFGGDASVIGRHIPINGFDVEIVGVMPRDFEFLVAWFNMPTSKACDIWMPLRTAGWYKTWGASRTTAIVVGLGRLNEGVSMGRADAELEAIAGRVASESSDRNANNRITLRSLRTELVEGMARGFTGTGTMNWLLFGAGAFVLLVACTNVSCLMVAQGTARRQEFAVRLALGSSRWHVVRLLLMESFVLATAGALVGVMIAIWGASALAYFAPIPTGHEQAVQVDALIVLFALVVVFLSTTLVGLPSVFAARDTDAADVMRAGGRGQAGMRGRHRLLRVLIIGQVAMALLLANTAVLFLSSYQKLLASNATLGTTEVLTQSLTLSGQRYDTWDSRLRFVDQLLERVKGLPGISHAAITSKLPLEGNRSGPLRVGEPGKLRNGGAYAASVSPEYFAATGIVLLKGRSVDPQNSQGVVINRAMALQAWPNEEALGKLIYYGDNAKPDPVVTVIGVVENVRQWSASVPAAPEVYKTHGVEDSLYGDLKEFFLVVRSTQDARSLAPLLQREVSALDSDLPLGAPRTLRDILIKSTNQQHFIAAILIIFTLCTVGLTMIGIYGTLSYYVAERTREIGVRMALGAQRGSVIAMILKRVGLWLAIGMAMGVGGIFAVAKILRALLFEIQPVYSPVIIASAVLILLAGLTAGLVPALRATKIQPIEALRAE